MILFLLKMFRSLYLLFNTMGPEAIGIQGHWPSNNVLLKFCWRFNFLSLRISTSKTSCIEFNWTLQIIRLKLVETFTSWIFRWVSTISPPFVLNISVNCGRMSEKNSCDLRSLTDRFTVFLKLIEHSICQRFLNYPYKPQPWFLQRWKRPSIFVQHSEQ